MRILISGAGIAGPTLAYWLHEHGFEPVLVEAAPGFRGGGYIIEFWGAGYDIAERMGLLPELTRAGFRFREVRMVDRQGKRVGGFPASAFDSASHGRFVSVRRGDLAAALHRLIEGRVDIRFGESIRSLNEHEGGVEVDLSSGGRETYDLVIGADGLHSRVRDLVFGEQSRFEKPLGYQVAAFEVPGYRPRDELVYVVYAEPGKQVARVAAPDDRTDILFMFIDESGEAGEASTLALQKARLKERFESCGWECRSILDALEAAEWIYYDRVSQVRMEKWASGRVALVGDSAFCLSPLGGQGSGVAMVAAYVLAGELKTAGGDYGQAFRRYESLLRPFVADKQRVAVAFGESFIPSTPLRLFLRNHLSTLLRLPMVARLTRLRGAVDRIVVPDYGARPQGARSLPAKAG